MMPFIYQDKENSTEPVTLAARSTAATIQRQAGKSFQINTTGITPRKALGDVNRTVASGKNQWGTLGNTPHPFKKSAHTFKKPCPDTKVPAPAGKPPILKSKSELKKSGNASRSFGPIQHLKKPSVQAQPSVEQGKGAIHVYCDGDQSEVEEMHLPAEKEDDFEDIWPKADRPESWIGLMRDFRPKEVCTFYDLDQDSGDEDCLVQPEEALEEILELDDTSDVPEDHCKDCWKPEDQVDLEEEGPKLEDIVLPPL